MLDIDLSHTTQWYEALYVILMLITCAVNHWARKDAKGDDALLKERGLNGTRTIQVKGNIRNETGRLRRSFGGLIIGVAFALRQPPQSTAWATMLAIGILLGLAVSDLYLSIRDRLDRKEVLAIEEEKAMRSLSQAQRIEVLSQELASAHRETAHAQQDTADAHREAAIAEGKAEARDDHAIEQMAIAQGEIASAQREIASALIDIATAKEGAATSEGKAARSEEHAQRAEDQLSAYEGNRNKGG